MNYDYFLDKNTGLSWVLYDIKNGQKFEKINDVLDSWSEYPSIKKFITNGRPLSRTFHNILGWGNNWFYAFEGEELVGSCLLHNPVPNYNFATIEYIVVNPKYQGKGVGTRMISSIRHNPQCFIGNYKGLISAFVNPDNTASKKAFLKNKFEVFHRAGSMIDNGGYFNLVYRDRELIR